MGDRGASRYMFFRGILVAGQFGGDHWFQFHGPLFFFFGSLSCGLGGGPPVRCPYDA